MSTPDTPTGTTERSVATPIPHKCPVCEGHGVVPGPPATPAGQTWMSTTGANVCPSCLGKRVVWAPLAREHERGTAVADAEATTGQEGTPLFGTKGERLLWRWAVRDAERMTGIEQRLRRLERPWWKRVRHG